MPAQPLPPPAATALDLIGRTPMVELAGFDTGPCRLFVKLESANPGGSIKDRIARSMIEAAEKDGSLKPGGTIVEATAGNTGLGLAQVGVLKGYRLLLVVPDKMAREKIQHLRAMGVDVRITRSDVGKGHPEYYQDMAAALAAKLNNAVYINQFSNPANPLAHETTTGPEILEQMEGDVDAVVVGVGSGGTLTGLGRFFRAHSPKTRMVLADPVGSILAPLVERGEKVEPGSWVVEGIGEDFIPDNCDLDLVAKAYEIPDSESIATARMLLVKAGILGGSSSGTLLAGALRYCRDQTEPKRVVTLVCDTGSRYLSKVYNDSWVAEQGLVDRELHGDLRDLIARGTSSGDAVTVGPDDTLLTAYNRMRAADVSQLPVLDDGRLIGLIDESDLLEAIEDRNQDQRFRQPVSTAMTAKLRTLQAGSPLEDLLPIFERDEVAIVMEGRDFLGLITRIDLINYLRRAA
ncbi:MAG: pyridoxal-phosphate dependent enzyme [Phenylobacterium sp.]|uniref:pyridoxal-phosphate dependent enzyme n=1 Tax=Phenylobacterium sp. TaxID=1871053 RepID=UPI001A59F873|nr:pyridoxal-phosphate dependent enzyme [Phenylobacterium sp.]MBL8555287.1 pyridoxal-phosphate dependent enzyme [Phenylobacterium sp.]